eukprot:283122_1
MQRWFVALQLILFAFASLFRYLFNCFGSEFAVIVPRFVLQILVLCDLCLCIIILCCKSLHVESKSLYSASKASYCPLKSLHLVSKSLYFVLYSSNCAPNHCILFQTHPIVTRHSYTGMLLVNPC